MHTIAATEDSRDFVRTEALKACLFYLLYDICWYQISTSSYTSTSTDIFSNSLPRQAVFTWMVGTINYCTLNLQYSVASAFTVALGLYAPQDWPRLMGRLRDVSTVRDFWGKFWHQIIRRASFRFA